MRFGLAAFAFISVVMEKGYRRESPRCLDQIAGMPEVLECYAVSGDSDSVIKVAARDQKAPSRFLMGRLMRLPGVDSVRSSMCLNEIKCTAAQTLSG